VAFLGGCHQKLKHTHPFQFIKKTVREIETGEGVLIFDDTLQEKPHSKENDLICWHYDHCVNRSVKGINSLSLLYS
jgi:hypothetical protein